MISNSSNQSIHKSLKWALFVYLICFFSVYFILQLKYRVAEVDDAWEASCSYHFLHQHITYDLFEGANDISSGIQYHRKAYAFLLGSVLEIIGWTKPNAYFLSLLFILGGFGCWYPTLRRLNYTQGLSATFCITGLLLDPFFSATLCAREEAFIFFISSLALLLFVQENYFIAMLLGWISLETHPTGAVAFFLMCAAFFAARPKGLANPLRFKKNFIPALIGFILGFIYFIFLHTDILNPQLFQKLLQSNQMSGHSTQNFLFDYFFHSKYNRHLLDLVLLVLCFIEFFRKKMFVNDTFILPLTTLLLLFSLIFERPQYHYVLYFYPAFLLILTKIFENKWGLNFMVWGLLVLLLPQYAIAYYINRNYDYNYEIQNYQKIIPADSLPIVGCPNAWFAFPSRDFYCNQYSGDIRKLGLKKFYLISDNGYREKPTEASDYIQNHFKAKPIGEFSMSKWNFIITLEEPFDKNHT